MYLVVLVCVFFVVAGGDVSGFGSVDLQDSLLGPVNCVQHPSVTLRVVALAWVLALSVTECLRLRGCLCQRGRMCQRGRSCQRGCLCQLEYARLLECEPVKFS